MFQGGGGFGGDDQWKGEAGVVPGELSNHRGESGEGEVCWEEGHADSVSMLKALQMMMLVKDYSRARHAARMYGLGGFVIGAHESHSHWSSCAATRKLRVLVGTHSSTPRLSYSTIQTHSIALPIHYG